MLRVRISQEHCHVTGWREAVLWARGQDLSRALPGHRVERSCAVGAWTGSFKSTARSQGGEKLCCGRVDRIFQEHCQVIGWKEAVLWARGQDLSRALPGHRVERSCAAGTWPGSLKSTARSQGGEKLCRGHMIRISQEHRKVIGWRETVPQEHGQDLSRALPDHRVERSCAVGT